MVRVRVRLGYTMAICLVLQHQVSTNMGEYMWDTMVLLKSQQKVGALACSVTSVKLVTISKWNVV